MQRIRSKHPIARQTPCLRRGTGLLLLLYLVAATPFALVMTTLLAASDPSHRVTVQQTGDGIQVRLRHDCLNLWTHRHGLVARALTLLADRSTSAHPDHVIQFGTGETLQQTPSSAIDLEREFRLLDQAFAAGDVLPGASRLASSPTAFPRPPPAAGGLLLTLHTTILVI